MQKFGIFTGSYFSGREDSRIFSVKEDLHASERPYWLPFEQLRTFFKTPYRVRAGTDAAGEVFAYIIEHLDDGPSAVADDMKFGVKVILRNSNPIAAPVLEEILSYLESEPHRDRVIQFTNDPNSTYVYC